MLGLVEENEESFGPILRRDAPPLRVKLEKCRKYKHVKIYNKYEENLTKNKKRQKIDKLGEDARACK